MLPTRSEIVRLVGRLSRTPLERLAALGLAELLHDPLAPRFLAEIVTAEPQLSSDEHCFPRHFAFGIIDQALEIRFEVQRFRLTKKLFRRLDAVSFYSAEHDAARQLNRAVLRCYWTVYRGYLALEHLFEDANLKPAERSTYVEDFLESLTAQNSMLISLMQYRLTRYSAVQRRQLLRTICDSAREGLKNEPISNKELLLDLRTPVRFRKENLENPDFWRTAVLVEEYLFDALRCQEA
jgi:hypothetical protein